MNKKWIAVIVMVALAALLAVPALAATTQDNSAWLDNMFSAKKTYVDQAVKDGKITPAQGETWKNHFDEMYKFHQENGNICPMGGPGQGKGQGMGFGSGKGMGRGGGMGGWNYNQAPAPVQ